FLTAKYSFTRPSHKDEDFCMELIKSVISIFNNQLSPEGISDRKVIVENRDYLFDDLINSMQKSSSLWDGRVKEYLAVRKYLQS
ncbi:hypothetical protein J4541_17245, partial [Klebsiella pneumoniae]|nr:hypothetical protein [Klebsiella pneumoniae]